MKNLMLFKNIKQDLEYVRLETVVKLYMLLKKQQIQKILDQDPVEYEF